MTALKTAVKNTLTGDSTLAALLTGGVFQSDDLPREGMTMDLAPKLGDGVRLQPFAVLRWRGSNPFGPAVLPTEMRVLEVWLYDDSVYTTIDSARQRIKTLLHRQFFTVSDYDMAYFLWVGDLDEFVADELGNAAAENCRFSVTLYRK